MNQALLADVIAWVGVASGVIGAVVVAPSGFLELVRKLRATAQRCFSKKPKTVRMGTGTSSLKVTGRGYGYRTLSQDLPQWMTVLQLVEVVNNLNKQFADFRKRCDDQHDLMSREIVRIEEKLGRANADIRRAMAAAARESASFNARGLPLIALGTVMTGPTGILAECVPVGCIFVALGACAVIYGIWPWTVGLIRPAKAPVTAARS